MKYKIQVITSVLVFFFSVSGAFAYSWQPSRGWKEWKSYNVSHIVREDGVAVVSAGRDPRGFVINIPIGKLEGPVRVDLRTMDVDSSVVCVLYFGNREVAHEEKKIMSGMTWRDYVFGFGGEVGRFGRYIGTISLVFKRAHHVEIKDIETGPPSFSDFFITRGLQHPDVNYTKAYPVFGYPCTEIFYLLLAIGLAGVTAYAGVKRNGKGVMLSGILFIALFVAYDLRNVYGELATIRETAKDFLLPPAGQKRFFWLDDMIDFGSFVKRVIPGNAGKVLYFGDRARFVYFRYLLYPIRLMEAGDAGTKYYVFYDVTDDKISEGPGEVFRYSPGAFVYKVP